MAVKNITTLDVTVVDDGNNESIFKLDNPNDNVTSLTQVRQAFQTALNGGWWYSRYDRPIISVAKAVRSITTRTELS